MRLALAAAAIVAAITASAPANAYGGAIVGGRPQGCPARFCGCGASLYLFGRIVPDLNLARNWRRFPSAAPAPRMAAWRNGHVFVLLRHIAGSLWETYDANSGGHRTHVHPRSISGFRIVNPFGSRFASGW